jgi:hypothetical protein
VHLTGTLTPECAGVLTTAIDAAAAPRPATDGTPDPRTPAMRRHDGLQHILEQVIAADRLLPSSHGSPYRLVVTVPHATLTAELHQRGSMARAGVQPGLLPDGWPISPLTAQTLACTADLVPVLVNEDHQPLDVGDTQYSFPPKIRTAIITRDKACTYPGCGAPAPWCHTHHLTRFRHGGPTSINNGALLCGRHHRYVHALGLTGRLTTTGGRSHIHWDHRPTSWTATTATAAAQHAHGHDPGGQHPTDQPVLTDRCLDELIRRWLKRHPHLGAAAA